MRAAQALTIGLLATATVLGALTIPMPHKQEAPTPALDAPTPLQEWTTADAGVLALRVVLGKLPPPDPRQRKAPCDPDLNVEINGYCWIPLAVEKCPKGKAFEHEGKCYAYSLESKRVPQSGEPRYPGVAEP